MGGQDSRFKIALSNLEHSMCSIDAHYTYGLARDEKSLGPMIDTYLCRFSHLSLIVP
jgi:hypothetical protein